MKTKNLLLLLLATTTGLIYGQNSPCENINNSYFTYTQNGKELTLYGYNSLPNTGGNWLISGTNSQGAYTSGSAFSGNATYLFDNSGTYDVKWVVGNQFSSCYDTIIKTITITDTSYNDTCEYLLNNSYFTYSIDGNEITLYGVKNNSYSNNSYWSLSTLDGTYTSGSSSTDTAVFLFNNGGIYTIDWTVSYYNTNNTYCSDTLYKTFSIYDSTYIDTCAYLLNNTFFTTSINGNEVTLNGTKNNSYSASTYWSPTSFNGFYSIGSNSTDTASFVYSTPGTYTVDWTVSYSFNSYGYFCSDTLFETITIYDSNYFDTCAYLLANTYYDYTIDGNEITLNGTKDNSNPSFSSWSLDNNDGIYTSGSSSTDTAVFAFNNSGTYLIDWFVEYTGFNYVCNDTLFETITIYDSSISPCDNISNSYFTYTQNGRILTLNGYKSDPNLDSYWGIYGANGQGIFTSGSDITENATYLFYNNGTYTVEWTVSYYDSNYTTYCADTLYKTITISDSNAIDTCQYLLNNSYFTYSVNGNEVILNGVKDNSYLNYSYWSPSTFSGSYTSGSNYTDTAHFAYNTPGTYTINWTVEYYNTNSTYCVDTLYKTVVILDSNSSSIERVDILSTMDVYPNPFKDVLNISFDSDNVFEGDIFIYSIAGKQLIHTKSTSNSIQTINVNMLTNGSYLLTLVGKNNVTKTTKLIKQ